LVSTWFAIFKAKLLLTTDTMVGRFES